MRGLLVKDFRLMLHQRRLFLLLTLIAVLLNVNSDGTFVIGYLSFVCTLFNLSSVSYDEADNCFPFLMTFPVRRRDYVREKYLLGLVIGGAAWLCGVVVAFLFQAAGQNSISMRELTLQALLYVPFILLFVALTLPLVFQYGSEKGRIVAFVLIGAAAGIIFLAVKWLEETGVDIDEAIDRLFAAKLEVMIVVAIVASAAVMAVSCLISERIMDKKEF